MDTFLTLVIAVGGIATGIAARRQAQISPTATKNSAPGIGPMPGKLVRMRASGRAKKRCPISPSMRRQRPPLADWAAGHVRLLTGVK